MKKGKWGDISLSQPYPSPARCKWLYAMTSTVVGVSGFVALANSHYNIKTKLLFTTRSWIEDTFVSSITYIKIDTQ